MRRTLRWTDVATLAAGIGVAVALATAAPARAVTVPEELPSDVPSELPSEVPSELPTEDPDRGPPPPDPTPDPTPTPDRGPTTGPTEPDASPTPSPSPSPSPTTTGPVFVPPGTPPGLDTVPGGGAPPPQVAPEDEPLNILNQQFVRVTSPDQLVGALGAFMALLIATILGGAATGVTTFTMTNRGSLTVRDLQGEIDMERTRRTRNVLGVALLGMAAIIGIVGYLRISVEVLVPVQVVYLASAGFGVVVFGIAGGSLLVAETLRADEHRVRELESAVAMLAGQVSGAVQDPPRLLDRGGGAAADADADATADGPEITPAADVPGSREDDEPGTRVVRRIVRRPPD